MCIIICNFFGREKSRSRFAIIWIIKSLVFKDKNNNCVCVCVCVSTLYISANHILFSNYNYFEFLIFICNFLPCLWGANIGFVSFFLCQRKRTSDYMYRVCMYCTMCVCVVSVCVENKRAIFVYGSCCLFRWRAHTQEMIVIPFDEIYW